MESYEYIHLGSYNRKSNYDQVLILERLKYKSMIEPQTDFKIHCLIRVLPVALRDRRVKSYI